MSEWGWRAGFLFCALLSLMIPWGVATVAELLVGGRLVGAVSGLMNFANTAATGCGVMFAGWLAQATGSFHAPFLFAVVVLAAGVLLYRFLLRATPSPRSDSLCARAHRP